MALLFSQPAFSTVVGGVFKGGDAAKAATGRMGREAWKIGGGGSWWSWGVLILGAGCVVVEKVKQKHLARLNVKLPENESISTLLHYLRATGVMKLVFAVATAALWHRLYSDLVAFVTSGWVSPSSMTNLPPILLQSRHEVSLFEWSVPSCFARAFIIVGDVLMSNPALSPPLGLAGTLMMGGGLHLAAIQPTAVFALNATCWALSTVCHLAFKEESKHPSTDIKGEFKGASFASVTNPSSFGKSGSSKLSLFGRSFDDICHYIFLFAVLLVRPRALSALLLLAFVYLKAPKRNNTYDRVFMALLAVIVLLHLNSASGFLQTTRVASGLTILMLGGPYLKEIFVKERGMIWGKVKEGWRKATK